MKEMTEFKGVTAYLLGPGDATEELAIAATTIYRDAYAARLSSLGIPLNVIEEAFEADPRDPLHVAGTRASLQKSIDAGWYWVVTKPENPIKTPARELTIAGFALYMTKYVHEPNNIFLADLHTHPKAQRRGAATLAAAVGLRTVLTDPNNECGLDTPVVLNVMREKPDDLNQHPIKFYRDIGFKAAGEGKPQIIGPHHTLPTQRMAATAGEVWQGLLVQMRRLRER